MALSLMRDPARPDRIIDTDPEHYVLVRTYYCPTDAVAALRPARGDALAGETAPMGYTVEDVTPTPKDHAQTWLIVRYVKPKLCRDVKVTGVFVAPTTTYTATEDFFVAGMNGKTITVTDVGSYVLTYVSSTQVTVVGDHACTGKTFSVSDYLAEVGRQITARTERGNYGHRRFVGLESTVEAAATAQLPIDAYWPGVTDMWGAYLHTVEIKHDVRPGIAYVDAAYRPADTHRALERNTGKGILEVQWIQRTRRLTRDLDGVIIDQVFRELDGTYKLRRWIPITGTPEAVESAMAILRVSVVLTSLPTKLIFDLIGTTNDAALLAFGDLGGVGMLMFLAPSPAVQLYRNSSLYLVRFHLAYCGTLWNETVQSDKEEAKIIELPVLKADDNPSGRVHETIVWQSLGVAVRKAKIAKPASWATLNGYLT